MHPANDNATPPTPPPFAPCRACDGFGYVESYAARSAHDPRGTVRCEACKGRGEVPATHAAAR